MTKAQIQNYLNNETLLRSTCIRLVEYAKMYFMHYPYGESQYQILNKYSPDEYIEFARKNLKDKLSKM